MSSVVELCNEALGKIGARASIASLEENSTEAKACNRFYDSVRRQLLRAAPWNFARRFGTLSMLKARPGTPENTDTPTSWNSAYPPPPWNYTYAYPTDAIFVRYVLAQPADTTPSVPIFSTATGLMQTGYPVNFIVTSDTDDEGNDVKVIATSATRPVVCYTRNITNTEMFDEGFAEALTSGLAGEICMEVTGKPTLQRQNYQRANEAILAARVADANEGLTVYDMVPDWLLVRDQQYAVAGLTPFYAPWGPLFGGSLA